VACAISNLDELYCWGANNHGQLGIGRPDVESTHIPQRVLDPL
jgi:alpha-tubulin suppressor-like RCC1 family protein